VNVAITVVVFYGSTRFRAPAEPALVLLAAAGAEALLASFSRRKAPDDRPVSAEGAAATA
jgi:hypothetical protein